MFELADRLVGIYKTNNTTKSVTINPRLMNEPSAQHVSVTHARYHWLTDETVVHSQHSSGKVAQSEPLADRTNVRGAQAVE